MTEFVNKIMDKYQPLTREQESTATNEELILHNVQFAITYAHRYAPKFLTPEEIVSEMFLALAHAADTFDRNRGTKFITHASWYIRGTFIDGVYNHQNDININGGQRKKELKVRRYIEEFEDKHGYIPCDKTISRELGISETTLKNLKVFKINSISSIFAKINDEEMYLADIIPCDSPTPVECALNDELYDLLIKPNDKLTIKQQKIVYDKYIKDMSYSELSKKYKLPYSKVRKYVEEGLKIMRSMLDD